MFHRKPGPTTGWDPSERSLITASEVSVKADLEFRGRPLDAARGPGRFRVLWEEAHKSVPKGPRLCLFVRLAGSWGQAVVVARQSGVYPAAREP